MSWKVKTIMSEDYYTTQGDGGPVSDSAIRKHRAKKTKIPRFRPIVKKKIPRTGFGEAMGGLTMGMLIIFPVIALLTMAFPKVVLLIIGLISFFVGIFSNSFKSGLLALGICLAPIVLGFISIGIYMAIFG